jgi:small subunit ribosomal protein S13
MAKEDRQKQNFSEEPKKENPMMKKVLISEAKLIRILSKDIPGDKSLYIGLQRINGVSWAFSNAVCKKLNISKEKKIQDLSEDEIKKISDFIKNPVLPAYMINRRKDYDSGEHKHLYGTDLDLQNEFDIKRLKKIKAYKGIRHMSGQPVRGQRTKSHFRTNSKKTGAVGVTKKKEAPKAKPAADKGGKK